MRQILIPTLRVHFYLKAHFLPTARFLLMARFSLSIRSILNTRLFRPGRPFFPCRFSFPSRSFRLVLPLLLLSGIFLPGIRLSAQTPAFVTDSLDGYIRQGLEDWQLPGLSLLVIKDGKVVVMKGYGVKDIVSKEPVDEHTLFMIASNTKLFTGTALSQLDYDHKLSLDDRFTKYYPSFTLYEPSTTGLLSIRDLLCHRIGTKTFQGDFTFWNSRLNSQEIMQKMHLLKPVKSFREEFGYCNSCFLAAGQVIPKVTGKSWQSYIRDSILSPLSMNGTYTSLKDVPAGANLSKAYTTGFTGTQQELPLDNWDNLAPAAAILSNVSDLAHWLEFQLDSGRFEGRQLMSFDILQQTRDMNTIVSSRKSMRYPSHITGYGLGLFQEDYNGRQVFFHTGGASGMVSVLTFVPEERLAIAVLSNNDYQEFFIALRNQLLDAYLGVPYVNRSKQMFAGAAAEMQDTLKTIEGWRQQAAKGLAPALPLASYAGRYTNPLYGSVDIHVGTTDKNAKSGAGLNSAGLNAGPDGKTGAPHSRLLLTFNGHAHLTATLDYLGDGDWLMVWNNMEYGIFKTAFTLSGGKVVSLLTKQNDEVEYDPYVFTKVQKP